MKTAEKRAVSGLSADTSSRVARSADHDTRGRFTPGNASGVARRFGPGNVAALNVGQHSPAFWQAQEAARREVVAAIVADAGHTVDDVPKALALACEGIAQAVLIRDAAFVRVAESGGPLTSSGRGRRAFTVWLAACDRVERHLKLVGLKRVPKHVDPLDAVRRAVEEAKQR